MTLKQEISKYVAEGNFTAIIQSAAQKQAQTCKYVQMNLFGDDREIVRWHAITALGRLAEVYGEENDEVYRNILRRELWAMNDESGNVPWSAPEVMAAIIKAKPKQYTEDFFAPMLTNGLENPMCHKGVLWAIGYLGKNFEKELAPFVPQILFLLEAPQADLRGYAVWALKQLGIESKAMLRLVGDHSEFLLYEDEKLVKKKISDMF